MSDKYGSGQPDVFLHKGMASFLGKNSAEKEPAQVWWLLDLSPSIAFIEVLI